MKSELTESELHLIRSFNDVKVIPSGARNYEDGAFRTRHSRVLFERHERVRVMYRSLIKHGFTKWEIANMMQVKESSVRLMANKVGLIWELKGLGEELPDAGNILHVHKAPTITRE